MASDASVSVIIPSFNRIESLTRVLPSYLASSAVLEVIIVDDASTDSTPQYVQQIAEQDPRLRYLRNERNMGQPSTRNRGASQAQGQWVLQSEDDLELGESCLETLLDHADLTQADVIAGRRIWMRLGESKEQALRRANADRHPPVNERWLEANSHASCVDDLEVPLLNGTMLIRRTIFDQLQYSVSYGGNSWREESDFQLSALEKGYRVVFCPHAVAFHYSRASQSFGRNRLTGTLKYARGMFRNNLLFLRKHQTYLKANLPSALFLGSPFITALFYGVYRGTWLIAAEIVRTWRTRKYGALTWE